MPTCNISWSSVADIRAALHDVWNNPTLASHILKNHKHDISVLQAKPTKPGRKAYLPAPDTFPIEVANLQKCLDDVKLESWKCVISVLPANVLTPTADCQRMPDCSCDPPRTLNVTPLER